MAEVSRALVCMSMVPQAVVLAAVSRSGFALGWAAEALRADETVAAAAARQDAAGALQYALPPARASRAVALLGRDPLFCP